jgi:hypothetical protein
MRSRAGAARLERAELWVGHVVHMVRRVKILAIPATALCQLFLIRKHGGYI